MNKWERINVRIQLDESDSSEYPKLHDVMSIYFNRTTFTDASETRQPEFQLPSAEYEWKSVDPPPLGKILEHAKAAVRKVRPSKPCVIRVSRVIETLYEGLHKPTPSVLDKEAAARKRLRTAGRPNQPRRNAKS